MVRPSTPKVIRFLRSLVAEAIVDASPSPKRPRGGVSSPPSLAGSTMGPMPKRVPLLLVLSLVAQTYACSSTNETIAPQGGAGGGPSSMDATSGTGGADA